MCCSRLWKLCKFSLVSERFHRQARTVGNLPTSPTHPRLEYVIRLQSTLECHPIPITDSCRSRYRDFEKWGKVSLDLKECFRFRNAFFSALKTHALATQHIVQELRKKLSKNPQERTDAIHIAGSYLIFYFILYGCHSMHLKCLIKTFYDIISLVKLGEI